MLMQILAVAIAAAASAGGPQWLSNSAHVGFRVFLLLLAASRVQRSHSVCVCAVLWTYTHTHTHTHTQKKEKLVCVRKSLPLCVQEGWACDHWHWCSVAPGHICCSTQRCVWKASSLSPEAKCFCRLWTIPVLVHQGWLNTSTIFMLFGADNHPILGRA